MIILPGAPELPPGVQLQCDYFVNHFHRCKNTPMRAPRVVVPSKTWLEPGHPPLKMFTTLHFCELHKDTVKLDDLLPEKVRVDFENTAKRKRPLDFQCDFDHAFIEFVLVTTPEYRQFVAAMGAGGIMRQAMGVQRLAG